MASITEYLREQAVHFRHVARLDDDLNIRRQLFSLARQCEEIAQSIEGGPIFRRHEPTDTKGH